MTFSRNWLIAASLVFMYVQYVYVPLQWPGWPPEPPSVCRCLLQTGCPAASSGPAEPELQPRTPSHSLTGLTGTRRQGHRGYMSLKQTDTERKPPISLVS